ncbi:MAG: putative glutamine amidotransferase [Candidatus Methanohalarchaeum thermophilum]|uniref:Glutamine amidotransferase n=1 Tax=Methanohalarchaeum thermophilum TaxID=1903181 RepID=A0A1Q6DVZ7_METT1|nr:MAG: putative glutamine amidotransferase [Candidatus Methanohalarchaeum thermophilum]
MLAGSFNKPISPSYPLKYFEKRDKDNPDGWGLGYFPDNSVELIKEPVKAEESKLYSFFSNYQETRSKIFITHLRGATVGELSHQNTHPFKRELNGNGYIFAHNGTLNDIKTKNLKRYFPIGDTDSEYAFCYLLDQLKDKLRNQYLKNNLGFLRNLFTEINKYGQFNCVISQGQYLFTYHDMKGYKGLHYLDPKQIKPNLKEKTLPKEIKRYLKNLKKLKGKIIATKPILMKDKWKKFDKGEYTVIKKGKFILREK